MKPAAFVYHRAGSVEEALELMQRLGDEAKFIAGGQSLVPMMNFRLARPTALVDISRIPGLSYLRREGDRLRVGALTTHRAVETATDPGVLDGYAVLPRAARLIGHYPIRTVGTFGGSIAHADPAAEWCLIATLLDAEMVARSGRGERAIPAGDFFQGFLTTALDPDEMLVEVRFPRPAGLAAIVEFARRRGDFAIAAAAVAVEIDSGVCRGARIAIGGVGSAPIRVSEAEAALTRSDLSTEVIAGAAELEMARADPVSDVHGIEEYRRKLAGALVRRALAEAIAGGG